MSRGERVVEFPTAEITSEDAVRRQMAEAERLANLSPGEWRLWIDDSAQRLGVPVERLKMTVKESLATQEKATREAKAETRRGQVTAQREQEREQARIEKAAARKRKEMEQAFKALAELPSKEQDARLADLAKRLDEDVETLRAEFEIFVGPDVRDAEHVEPWPEPVDTQALLAKLMASVERYVVLPDKVGIAVALWTMMAWVHAEIATHSPILVVTSAEPDCGKSTLLGVLSFLAPRPYPVVELTGPGLYRVVDHTHPTLIVDEADRVFHRRTDLLHIINASWTRGTKIPRMIGGVVHQFDPFCPKIIGMKGLSMPSTLASRGIIVKLWPKTVDENVEDFNFSDNDEFEQLRRNLTRWSADNAAVLKDLHPAMPPGFGNRRAANWKLLFAIAQHAACLPQACRAATRLARRAYKQSEGVRLLAALRAMFGTREVITSAEVVERLKADPDGEWGEFRGRSPISQRQVAILLSDYDIEPGVVHPTKRADFSRRG